MIRPAKRGDLPRLLSIRDTAAETPLTNTDAITEPNLSAGIDSGTVWLWQEPAAEIAGFVAIDPGGGTIPALLVAAGQGGQGVGRALLRQACAALREAGHGCARIAVPRGRAERHFAGAGWAAVGPEAGDAVIFQKPL